jgi:regulation of enolase protein 1 (concanavalin A-like superfamily)
MKSVSWSEGKWVTTPLAIEEKNGHLLVTAAEKSDFWRNTSYHFIHDDGHALLKEFPDHSAVEVSFILDYTGQFDQCGIFIRNTSENWIKTGVEYFDGAPHVGAVVTRNNSDWSMASHPDWFGKVITFRASRDGNAITIRAKADGEFELVRVAPIDTELDWVAGPYICAPTRAGLVGEFVSWCEGAKDPSLH